MVGAGFELATFRSLSEHALNNFKDSTCSSHRSLSSFFRQVNGRRYWSCFARFASEGKHKIDKMFQAFEFDQFAKKIDFGLDHLTGFALKISIVL